MSLLLAVACLLPSTPARADSSAYSLRGPQGVSVGGSRRPAGAPTELRHEILQQLPPDLKIPLPPDAKFMSGYRTQYTSNRLITAMRFVTANSTSTLSDWYQKSLSAAGWKVAPMSQTGKFQGLTAFRPGLYCSVSMRDTGNAKTTVIANYSEMK